MGVMEKLLQTMQRVEERLVELPENIDGKALDLKGEDKATFTAGELADLLGVHQNTIYEQTRQGRIPHIKLNSKIVFPKAAIQKWIMETAEKNYTRNKELETPEIDLNMTG